MKASNRRQFLHQAGLGAAGIASLASRGYAQVAGANDRVTVAVIGCGGMGMSHVRNLLTQKDVNLAHVCEVDRTRLANAAKTVEEGQRPAPQTHVDLRRVLEDRNVQAVFIATPDHWHAPATLLALEAGKHVYVEKPCSHNIREGRLMIDAARKHRKVVQVGTQSRSAEHSRAAMELLHKGTIGDILAARVWNSQLRSNIGKQKPSDPPKHLEYDLWLGPVPFVPYQANRSNPRWRWCYHFGTGDMGNDGVHDIDIGLWGLGVTTHPSTVAALGGKYFFDDDQQFPDTQTVVCEWPGNGSVGQKKQLIFEQRIWTPYKMEGYENGDAFYGTRGMMIFGKEAGWRLYGPRNKEIKTMSGSHTHILPHHRNFFDCLRGDGKQLPNADIEINHRAATLCHLGNIATRLGRVLHFDPKTEQIIGDKEANALVQREYREGHWAVPRGL